MKLAYPLIIGVALEVAEAVNSSKAQDKPKGSRDTVSTILCAEEIFVSVCVGMPKLVVEHNGVL